MLFEVDRDDVFDHKEPLLEQLQARPKCDRQVVRADLSRPWTDAIINALAVSSDPARAPRHSADLSRARRQNERRARDGEGPFPAVLALGGSDGGVPEALLDLLVPEGFACLGLAYFGTDGTQPSLIDVPLERIERGLRWLAAHPKVATRDGRVAVMGGSKGGELALLVAATFPDLVGPVVAYTPSSVVWAGIDFTQPRGARRSSWSLAGAPLPCVPYPEGVQMLVSERGFSGLPVYDEGLDNAAAVREATISVERATGPLLLISGGDDRLWPATRMCHMVAERMRLHGRADDVSHLNYPDAGHVLFLSKSSSRSAARPPIPFDFGGSREAGAAAHADAWPQVVAHVRQGAEPA